MLTLCFVLYYYYHNNRLWRNNWWIYLLYYTTTSYTTLTSTAQRFFRPPCLHNSKFSYIFSFLFSVEETKCNMKNKNGCRYVEHVLETERENMRCCKIDYKYTVGVKSYQTLVYGGILVAGFLVYFLVIFFSSPPAR